MRENTKPSVVAEETAEKSAVYPPPYKVKNNCLYVEKTNKQGPYDQKLCNFTPYLTAEITVDDGACETKRLRIGGEHENGRTLKEIEIAGSELASFNWLLEHWGIDCNLEIGCSIKDSIRYAIQSTAPKALRETIYTVTGWKKINGKWKYLLPGDDTLTVELTGKLKRYEMAKGYSIEDIAIASAMLDVGIAPKEIIYPLIAFAFLSPLNEFLHRANCEPKFVMLLLGKTGTRKSTLAALFLSFFGRFTASDLPLSFRDTANSILHHAYELKDVLTCIDDFHPCGRQEEQKLTSTAQSIMRAYGDRTGRGRLKADSSPMNSRPPQGNALITAEFAPDIGESGTARYFALELKNDAVDLSMLSSIQVEAAKGVLANSMGAYIEMVGEIANRNENEFIKALQKSFEIYRNEFNECGIKCHGRVPEIVAWLRIGMKMFLNFLKKHEMILPERIDEINTEFKEILHGIAKRQSENIEQDKPTYKFIRKLISLIESGNVSLADKNEPSNFLPNNFIGYEDDEFYYLNKTMAHKAVKKLCEEQGESFSVSEQGLLKALAEEKLIQPGEKQNTKSVRFGNRTQRVVCLYKNKAQIINDLTL